MQQWCKEISSELFQLSGNQGIAIYCFLFEKSKLGTLNLTNICLSRTSSSSDIILLTSLVSANSQTSRLWPTRPESLSPWSTTNMDSSNLEIQERLLYSVANPCSKKAGNSQEIHWNFLQWNLMVIRYLEVSLLNET